MGDVGDAEDQITWACIEFIEKEVKAKFEEEDEISERAPFDMFRRLGAAMTVVKKIRFQLGQDRQLLSVTTNLNEVIGLLLMLFREKPLIPLSSTGVRESLLKVAEDAFQELENEKVTVVARKHIRTRANSSSSEASNSSGGSSKSSMSSTNSRKEMTRAIAAKRFVSHDKVAQAVAKMEAATRKRTEKMLWILSLISQGSEEDSYCMALVFAPMLARPPNTVYMSIRHSREALQLRLVLWVWLENFDDIMSAAAALVGNKGGSTPPISGRRLSGQSKPRLSSVSSVGAGGAFSPPNMLNSSSDGESSAMRSSLQSPSQRCGHIRKKTPPRISDLLHKRRADIENLESFITTTVELVFSPKDSSQVSMWLAHESGDLLPVFPSAKISSGKRIWASKERIAIEKRVLKKRLLHWGKEFEQREERKPDRDDRVEMRAVFAAYGALKNLLAALEADTESAQENLLVLEKKALQAVLKLFEKDFEERMNRKVEVAEDIVGRELEYSRYKELKEQLNPT